MRQRQVLTPRLGCRALEEHGVVSYGEVTRHTLGRSGQRLVDTLLIVSQTGAALHPMSPARLLRAPLCSPPPASICARRT